MRVRTYVFCVAAALCAVLPASAAAAIDSIVVQPNSALPDFLCLGSSTTSPVRLALTTVEGTTLQTITLPAADNVADTGCPASANTFEPGAAALAGGVQPAFHRYPAGARITATQDGTSVTFALPYGAYSQGTTRLRGLPNPAVLSGGVVAAAAPGTYTGVAVTQGDPVVANGTVADSTAAAIPISETITPAQYRVSLDSGTVTIFGADPLANSVGATLSAPGGGLVGRAALRPRIGSDCPSGSCSASGTFDAPSPSGGALAVAAQTGWFAGHNITLPSGALRLDGFDVSVPAGYTGSYDYTLKFFDPESVASLPLSNPLSCTELGGAVTCPGGVPTNRIAVSVGGVFIVPGDFIDVTGVDADGDSAMITPVAGGLSGSLDDGSLIIRAAPRAQLTAALKSPLPAPADPYTETYTDRTDETGTDTLVDAFSVHIANGATATVSGPATGPTPQTFMWRLAVGIDGGAAVRGSTYGLGVVAIDQIQGGRTQHFQTAADIAGNFAVQLTDARPGDVVNITAADQGTHQTTTSSLTFGGSTAKITGVSDGQYVRGTITPTVAGTGLDTVFWNGVDATLPTLLAPTTPFPYPLDTTKWDDGTYRLEASGRPDATAYDYLYVTIDNTPPNGSAGNDQTVGRGSKAIIVTGAGDDTSGLASVKVDFGDKHRLTQSDDNLGLPVSHVYTKIGTYTATVTITDGAGNVTSDTAKIRVATTVAPQIGGNFAGKLVHKKSLAAKLVGRKPGQLEIFILSQTGARKLTKRVTFTKANQAIKVTLLTKGLKLGRFVVVEQFTDANGVAGPVQARALRVVKK
jgi:PKD domain